MLSPSIKSLSINRINQYYDSLGNIRNKCENFTLDLDDGIYKDKSDKEVIKMAVDTMNTVIKTVDCVSESIEKIPKLE